MSEHGLALLEGPVDLDALALEWANAAHSIFGPSRSAMYLICLGSLIPNLLADDKPTYEAAEGTVAHFVGDRWLREGEKAAHDMIGEVHVVEGFHIAVTELMLVYLRLYVDWCRTVEGDHYYETRTDISHLTPIPKQLGTADHYALSWQHMVITDLKYGEGVKVYAADDKSDPRGVILSDDWNPESESGIHHSEFKLNGNSQALLYAIGVFAEWDWFYNFQTITIRICQPRLDHFDEWVTTREELLIFAKWAKIRMREAWKPGQPRTPSAKGCRWCRIEKTCPAQLTWAADQISGRFQDLDAVETGTYSEAQMRSVMEIVSDPTVLVLEPIEPLNLTIDQMANVLRYRGVIEGWFKKIEQHLKLLAGEDVDLEIPFWKLVEGRSRRKFGDVFAAEARLLELGLTHEQIWVEKMISPNQAEELLRAKLQLSKSKTAGLIVDHVIQPPGPPTLVPVNDKREQIALDGDRFDDLDEPAEDDEI